MEIFKKQHYCNTWQRNGDGCGSACWYHSIDWSDWKTKGHLKHICKYYKSIICVLHKSKYQKIKNFLTFNPFIVRDNSPNDKVKALPYCYKTRKLKLKKLNGN